MSNNITKGLAQALEAYEKGVGLEALGCTLSAALCAVSARISSEAVQVWPVETPFIEGEVHVVLGPDDDIIDRQYKNIQMQ